MDSIMLQSFNRDYLNKLSLNLSRAVRYAMQNYVGLDGALPNNQ